MVKRPKVIMTIRREEESRVSRAHTLQEQVPVSSAQLQRPCFSSQVSTNVPLRSQLQDTQSGKPLKPREHWSQLGPPNAGLHWQWPVSTSH